MRRSPRTARSRPRDELAHDLVADLQRVDAERVEVKRRLTKLANTSSTTVTQIHGVGPIIVAALLGYTGDVQRFTTRDHFAAYNGTAPIEASSGNRTIHRLSSRDNRQLNHAIHMAAVTQIRNNGTTGRIYYDRKIADGMGRRSALRALKRKISDAIYARLLADTRHEAEKDPGGQTRNDSASSVASSHPETPALRTSHSRVATQPKTARTAASPTTPARRRTTSQQAS